MGLLLNIARWSSHGGRVYFVRCALVALAYFASAKLGLALAFAHGSVTAVWPPTGVALAAVIIWGPRMWPAVAVGAFLANVTTSAPLLTVAGITIGNTLEALCGGYLISRVQGFRSSLERVRDVVALVVLGALISTTVSATIGVLSLRLGGAVSANDLASVWRVWWFGDMGGDLLVAPAVLVLTAIGLPRRRLSSVEVLAAAVLAALSVLVFSGTLAAPYVLFPALFWVAMLLRQPGSVAAGILLSATGVYFTARGQGPFVDPSPDTSLLHAQTFVGVATVTALLMGAVLSERKHAEAELLDSEAANAALRESQLTLAEAQQITHIGSWQWDVAADTVSWSDELYAIYGLDPETFDATYEGYLACVHPEDRVRQDSTVRQAFADGAPRSFEHRIVRPDGNVRELQCSLNVTMVDGAAVSMNGTAQDITERVRAQRKFEQFLEFAPDAIVGVGRDGAIVLVNAQTERLFGYTREELVGQRIEMLIPDRFHGAHADHRAGYFGDPRTRPMGAGVDLFARRKDGSEFPAEISLSSIETEDGVLATAAVRDVTERVQAERELAEARRNQASRMESIGQLAGGVAHDFNNILGVILNYADFAAGQLPPGSPVRDDVEEIRRAAERAAALTRQLLLFSRGDAGDTKVLDVNRLLLELEKLLQRAVGEHVTLHARLASDLPCVEGDPGHIEQILVNLVVNARDAMPEGGEIVIETASVRLADGSNGAGHGRYVRIVVSDTGAGMSNEVRQRAFEPFFTTKPKARGTGLGLATVYGLIRQAGGFVTLASEPGAGTVVTIHLPASSLTASIDVAPDKEPAVPAHGTILLVEDEPAVRRMTERILVQHGYDVVAAESGVEALELCARPDRPIDLLLTDVVMPHMFGTELVDRLAVERPEIDVLYMTGYADEIITRQIVDARGTDAVIEKPFSAEALLQRIRVALDGTAA